MIRHISSLRYLIVAALCFGLAMQVSGAFSKAPDIDAISKTHALAPEEVHGPTAKSIVTRLKGHYLSLDDSTLSERLLDRYLQDLDPNKIYFLSTDIKKIERYRKAAYEQIKKGDLSAGFDIFNLYQERVQERLDYLLSLLEDGLPSFDFGEDAELLIDREEAEWEPDVAALNHLWDQRLAHAIISMRLDGVSDEEVHKRLQRRYKSQKKRMQQNSAEDVFQFYMNALGQVYDPHTSYFTPHTSENFNINMSRSLEGIGAVLQADEEYTKIVSLVPGGPAAKGGQLQVADRIIGVGQEKQEIVNVIGWRLDEVVELIRGPKGTKVRLEVIPAGSVSEHTTREIEIERNKVVLEEQAAKKHYITLPATGNEAEKRIAIITLPAFYIDFDAYHKGDPNYTSTTRDVAKLLLDIAKDRKSVV